MADSEVGNKKGIYEYVFDKNQRHLNLRQFDDNVKRSVYEKQHGICPMCKGTANAAKKWSYEEMEGDHDTPWSKGGKTTEENCVMLCRQHNREKSDII
ncbi:MAG: HNH endonuclease signature motif containing protein [Alphaproteobacteria bacterium]|nr:HNH endonuclease signature motif containing protein [Alphaproteobacteria bacterium]